MDTCEEKEEQAMNNSTNQDKHDSHIQMPKCALKQFEDVHHKFYYFDVEKGIIGTNGHAGSTNTEENYFSLNIEQFFSSNFEKPYSDLFEQVCEISYDPPQGHIDDTFDYVAKRFVYALLSRNPGNIEERFGNPILREYATEQELHDLGVVTALAAEVQRDFLKDYGTTVIVNSTEVPFVLPTCGIYQVIIHGFNHVILPVSPEKAVAFIEEKGKSRVISDGIVRVYSITQEKDITVFNNTAFSTQTEYGFGFVVSPRKEPLEIAKRVILDSGKK